MAVIVAAQAGAALAVVVAGVAVAVSADSGAEAPEEEAPVAAGKGKSKPMDPQAELKELVPRVTKAAGENLEALVLYGSAADGEFHHGFSDLNILCLLREASLEALRSMAPVTRWWLGRGHPAMLIFAATEIERSSDVFAIELYDIKRRHRVLAGKDVFASLEIPMDLHRVQIERELRTNLLRLRQGYLAAAAPEAVLEMMVQSVASFGTIFRHVLIAHGEEPAPHRRQITARLAEIVGFNAAGCNVLFDVREGRMQAKDVDVDDVFRLYLRAIEQVTNWVDHKFSS